MLNLIRLKIILTAIYGVFYHSRSPSYTFSHLIHIGALWRGSLPFPHPPGGRKKRSIYLLLDCTSLFYKYLIHTYIHKILTVKYVLSMFMSLQVRLTLLLNRRTRFVGPRSPVLLLVLLQPPPPKGWHCLFWPWWLFPLQAPLTSVCRNSWLCSQSCWMLSPLGRYAGQYGRLSHLIRTWVHASPTAPPASEILWWGQGKVLLDASLTKGRHCCFYPYAINYCLLPAHHLHHISLKSLHSAPAPGNHRPGNCGFPSYSLMSFSLLHPT